MGVTKVMINRKDELVLFDENITCCVSRAVCALPGNQHVCYIFMNGKYVSVTSWLMYFTRAPPLGLHTRGKHRFK